MKITYKNWMFDSSRTEKAAPTREQSLSCESISADTLTIVVRCDDPSIMSFQKNDAIRFWENDSNASMQTYYLRSIERTGATAYKIVAWSAVGLLATIPHKGGIYTGQTVSEVISDICGAVPVVVKSVFANVKLYGWLPYCQPKTNGQGKSARDNLAQVLFAIGAYLTTDLNGVLHIDSLWDGTASVIQGNRMYLNGGKVGYSDPISAVTVTEHQYVAGTEVKELFSGTAQNGDIITFSEPMHSLSATGFTILESGTNYAKISAGTGALTGKAYIHNTRLITQPVTAGAAENVKSVTDATLVSLVNSYAVAKRLADYYRCRETITNDIVSGHEKPGHVVSVYHPYDKKMVPACIRSLDTTMSATLKSSMEALVGFKPAQPETAEYFDVVEILTGSGEWEVPPDVTVYTRVLIGGAQGGWSGLPGGRAEESRIETGTTMGGARYAFRDYTDGGPGGSPGAPGAGGKVLTETVFNAVPGEKIPYSCGKGGKGGIYSADGSVPGEFGTATTMGAVSSEKGASSDDGYTDINSGKKFAERGLSGVSGSKGRGRKYVEAEDTYVDLPSPDIVVDGVHYTAGADNPTEKEGGAGDYAVAPYGYLKWIGQGGLGGGAAYKANGGQATDAPDGKAVIYTTKASVTCWGGRGGKGADALPPDKETKQYGRGGAGGNGGGGAGGTGKAYTRQRIKDGLTLKAAELNPVQISGDPGKGSDGGEGADGCIILYYRKFGQVKAGPLVQRGGGLFFDRLNKLFIV